MMRGSGSKDEMKDFLQDALRIVVLAVVVLAVGCALFPWWRDEPRKLAEAFAAVALYAILLAAYRRWLKTSDRHKR